MSAPDPLLLWFDVEPLDEQHAYHAAAVLRTEVEEHVAHGNGGKCLECGRPWPCPTRQRIAKALGVTL
jgi:hypothetical protein